MSSTTTTIYSGPGDDNESGRKANACINLLRHIEKSLLELSAGSRYLLFAVIRMQSRIWVEAVAIALGERQAIQVDQRLGRIQREILQMACREVGKEDDDDAVQTVLRFVWPLVQLALETEYPEYHKFFDHFLSHSFRSYRKHAGQISPDLNAVLKYVGTIAFGRAFALHNDRQRSEEQRRSFEEVLAGLLMDRS